MHLVLAAMLVVLSAGLSAQCARPTPPPDGFPLQSTLSVPVTYSDGYQTFAALMLPSAPAPSCGWPLVVYVHRLGHNRFEELSLQTFLAEQGFAVWSYDVRGQGEAMTANVGHIQEGTTLWGPIERHDLAEQIAFVAAEPMWQGVVDTGRLGIVGTSQGGAHAWTAAASAGTALTTPGRTPITFPQVDCIVPRDLVACSCDDWLRGGLLFSTWWIEAMAVGDPSVTFDPAFVQQARAGFVAQDPASLLAAWQAEGREIGPQLVGADVPTFYTHAYHDLINSPLSALQRLSTMQAPTRTMLSTLGHGVVRNQLEEAANDHLTLRWLNRFLWDEANEVELEPAHLLALMPLDAGDRDDPQSAWSREHVDELITPSGAERFHLYDDLLLRSAPPSTPQGDVRVEQVLDPAATSFTPTDYFDQASVRALPNVLSACPLDEQVWSMTMPADVRLLRSPTLHLELTPDQPEWMLAALLTVQPVGGDEVLLSSNAVASRSSVAGVVEVHDLRLPPVGVEIPANATLRLRLRNLWLREFPMTPRLAVAPIFGDFGVDLTLENGNGCWLDLPLQPSAPHLVVDRQSIDLALAQPVQASLRGGLDHSEDPYFVALSLGGMVPGTPYLGEVFPLEDDWLLVASAGNTGAYYTGFLGFLDTDGNAQVGFDFSPAAPLPQFLNATQISMAAFVWDFEWASSGQPTNACEILLK
jgi:predicted acyl esterase